MVAVLRPVAGVTSVRPGDRSDVEADVTQEGGIQALLLGGRADGRAVRLHELHRELVVSVAGVVTVQASVDHVTEPLAVGMCRYTLVEPVGPEMPVYVQS
jgi:hypothetical protein